ncbi:MAG: LPXTG cell wall anchor domain-containing protein, partial [Firmicutes bacterium]|nr:LPXTG cell wall anchor domain-containing protein [Bacillota bacterium]
VDLKNSTVYVKEEFLRRLRKGDHDIKIVLEDGSIATSFTVIKTVPWLLYAGIALLLLLLLLLLWFFMKRRKNR